MPDAPLLRLRGVSKSFGALPAVHPLDLDVTAGDFCAILGPSGCGKSTLLRMIAGFAEPSGGRIEIEGQDVTRWGPERRPTNMVFQGYGLFPHLDVGENVAFGLSLLRRPPDEIARRVAAALALVRLDGFARRPVDRLSGGQQQRVALARALVMRPKILLLDEPLAALDLKLRHEMQDELRRIHREIGGTFVFVTHDQGEAFALANRVIVMNAGRVEQVGEPRAVYGDPATLFVARFVGETTVLEGTRRWGRVTMRSGAVIEDGGLDGPVQVLVRPERIGLGEGGGAEAESHMAVRGTVADAVFLGSVLKVTARLASGETLVAHLPPWERVEPGAEETFSWGRDALRVVGPDP